MNKTFSWIIEARHASGEWGTGCFLCHAAGKKSAFGRVTVSARHSVTMQSFKVHGESEEHRLALGQLAKSCNPASEDRAEEIEAAVSGLPNVPRVDRYMAVVKSVVNYCTYQSHHDNTDSVGSFLEQGAPGHPQEAKQILASLDGPLQDRIRKAMRQAVAASIALDKSADILVLVTRMLLPSGIFDTVLGLEMDMGSEADDVSEAVEKILQRACMKQLSRRDPKVSGMVRGNKSGPY